MKTPAIATRFMAILSNNIDLILLLSSIKANITIRNVGIENNKPKATNKKITPKLLDLSK